MEKEKLTKLRGSLPKGAVKQLAEEYNFSESYIRMVLYGTRENINVIESAIILAEKEKKRKEAIKRKLEKATK